MMLASRAEEMRRSREAFCLAMEIGCTVREADDALARRRWSEAVARLDVRRKARTENCGTRAIDDFDAPWMMRD